MNLQRLISIRQSLQNLTVEEASILVDALETKINLLTTLNEELEKERQERIEWGIFNKDRAKTQALLDKILLRGKP
jgi:hypothetical protein